MDKHLQFSCACEKMEKQNKSVLILWMFLQVFYFLSKDVCSRIEESIVLLPSYSPTAEAAMKTLTGLADCFIALTNRLFVSILLDRSWVLNFSSNLQINI